MSLLLLCSRNGIVRVNGGHLNGLEKGWGGGVGKQFWFGFLKGVPELLH
jgi:hypothetical protein